MPSPLRPTTECMKKLLHSKQKPVLRVLTYEIREDMELSQIHMARRKEDTT